MKWWWFVGIYQYFVCVTIHFSSSCYLICVLVNIDCRLISSSEMILRKGHLEVQVDIAAESSSHEPESTVMWFADCHVSVMAFTQKPSQLWSKHFSVQSDWASYIYSHNQTSFVFCVIIWNHQMWNSVSGCSLRYINELVQRGFRQRLHIAFWKELENMLHDSFPC